MRGAVMVRVPSAVLTASERDCYVAVNTNLSGASGHGHPSRSGHRLASEQEVEPHGGLRL